MAGDREMTTTRHSHAMFSDRSLDAFAQFVARTFSHADLNSLFLAVSVPPHLDPESNKLNRVLSVVTSLSQSTQEKEHGILRKLIETAVSRRRDMLANRGSGQHPEAELIHALKADGFDIIDGQLVHALGGGQLDEVTKATSRFDAPELQKQIQRMKAAIDSDPGLAVGTAKELLETTCKTILRDRQLSVDDNWDVVGLVKKARAALKLLPEDVHHNTRGEEALHRLLGSLGTVAQSVAELRNLYGTGHGKDGRDIGVGSRHAKLAVGAAAALATFLFETHEAHRQ